MSLLRIYPESLPQIINVKVKSPDGMLFEGKVKAISSMNKNGNFDIIPYHTNIISIIKDTLVLYETRDTKRSIAVQQGIIKVMSNDVHIYLGIKTVL